MTTRGPSRRLATTYLALTLAVVLAGCGSSTPPTSASASPATVASATPVDRSPSPTATSTPAPSPTPKPDVAKPFLAILTSRTFAATAKIAGEFRLGSATFPVTGTYDVRGSDNRQSMTIAIPKATQTTESLTAAGVTYTKRGGLWFVKPAAAAGSSSGADLASSLRSLLDLVDTGTVTKGGRTLHHLEPRGSTSIPLSAFGASDPTGDGVVTLDFYAEEDGTPVVMTIAATWTQPTGKTTERASMTIDYTFSNVGGQVVIDAPQQVWTTFKSKRFGYTMSHPVDWEAEQSPAKRQPDTFYSAEATGVVALRAPSGGFSLNALTSAYVREVKGSFKKVSMSSNKATTIDGVKARRIEFAGTYKGTPTWHVEIVVVRGKNFYVFDYSSLAKLTTTDRAIFDAFVSTVDLP